MKTCLCGHPINNSILLADKIRFDQKARILKCNNCSLIYLDQNSVDFPDKFYEKEYHQTYLTHIEPDALDPKKYFDKMLKVTKIWSDKFKQRGWVFATESRSIFDKMIPVTKLSSNYGYSVWDVWEWVWQNFTVFKKIK